MKEEREEREVIGSYEVRQMVILLVETLIEIHEVGKKWKGDILGRFTSRHQSIQAFVSPRPMFHLEIS